MDSQKQLNVQCFVKRDFESIFTGDNIPKLLYVSQVHPAASMHPRVMHAHKDFIEIVLICSGISEYLIHDKKQYIRKGDLLIYNSGVVHDEISGPDIEIGSYCIAIGGLHMPGLRENALIPDDAGYIFPTGEDFETLHTLCEMMFKSLSADEPHTEAFCYGLLHSLLVKVLTVVGMKEELQVEEPSVLGQRIKAYIDENFSEPITLQSMSTDLHISPYYLSHVFKQMSGYAPMQYLLKRRIGEAQTLLITTDLPVSVIAGMVGYDSQSYFNLQFSKHVGMPPKKYRQSYVISEGKQ